MCRLKKYLYKLKQATRAWYGRIDSYLQQMRFVKSDTNPNPYYLMVEDEPLILVLYVDDIFLTRSSGLIEDCKRNLAVEFDMKDLGLMHYFLGLEVWQKYGEIFHRGLQEESGSRVRHEGIGVDALFPRIRSVAEVWGDLPWSRKICYKYSEEVQNAGLQTHVYTHDHQLEEDRCIK